MVTRSVVTESILPGVKEPLLGCPDLFTTGQTQVTLVQPVQNMAWRRETEDAGELGILVTWL